MKKIFLSLGLVVCLMFNCAGTITAAGSQLTTSSSSNDGQVQLNQNGDNTYLTTNLVGSGSADPNNPDYRFLPSGFARDFTALFTGILSILMALVAILVFAMLVWGGVEWILSGGDKGRTEQARNKIFSALIGLLIVAASYAILYLVLRFLGYSSLTEIINDIKPIAGPRVNRY